LICPHCSQWNRQGASYCVFCRNRLDEGIDRTSTAGPPGLHGVQASPDASAAPPLSTPQASGADRPKESGSPADIARALRIASIVGFAIVVVLGALYRICSGF
jgi:hypothetical protein